jgi:hypothetical protein
VTWADDSRRFQKKTSMSCSKRLTVLFPSNDPNSAKFSPWWCHSWHLLPLHKKTRISARSVFISFTDQTLTYKWKEDDDDKMKDKQEQQIIQWWVDVCSILLKL